MPLLFPIKAVFIYLCTGPPRQQCLIAQQKRMQSVRLRSLVHPPPLLGQSRGFPVRGAGIKRLILVVIASQTKPGLATELQRAVPTEEAGRHLGLTSSAQLH